MNDFFSDRPLLISPRALDAMLLAGPRMRELAHALRPRAGAWYDGLPVRRGIFASFYSSACREAVLAVPFYGSRSAPAPVQGPLPLSDSHVCYGTCSAKMALMHPKNKADMLR
jgi:hypothetical protein